VDYVSGLGGREINPGHIEDIYDDLMQIAETGEIARGVVFLDVRGEEHQSAAKHRGRNRTASGSDGWESRDGR
jgi:hypothetical protein